MLSSDPAGLTAARAAARIREGALSPVDLVEACLARIRALDGHLLAWVHVDEAGVRAAARERDAEARRGALRGPLHGVPVAAKDIFHVAGMPTRAGARPWAETRPGEDAVSVARLRAAGAVVLGKTATTEFAHRDPAPTRNPWNPEHTPGGSSSGSGAGVAARMAPLALGSQTMGSTLRPAAYCGIVGFKATHGAIPAAGVIPLAWSLDHVGVLARSVEDAALAFGVLAARSVEAPKPGRPRIALARPLLARCEPAVAAQIQAAADAFGRAGARIVEVALPGSLGDLLAAGQLVLDCEAAAYHEPSFRVHAAEYGPEIRKTVEIGLRHPATAYVNANRARLGFRSAVMPLLASHDVLLAPTAPGPAPRGLASTGDASLCAPWSFCGVPAISLPSGVASSGLPHAIQLVAAADREAELLGVAAWCEGVLGFAAAPSL